MTGSDQPILLIYLIGCPQRKSKIGPEYEKIEIKAINVVNGSEYETGLPVGTYSLAASSFEYETQNPDDFIITDGGDTDVDVTF